MDLKQFNLKLNTSQIFISFFLTAILYLIITAVILLNFAKVVGSRQVENQDTIIEALLYPKGVPNVSEVFYVDPLLTATENESIVEIRKGISYLIFSSLFKESPSGEMIPDIIESYDFKDAKTLNLKIKQGIEWHDGEKLTAEDVVFTLNLIRSVGDTSLYYGAVNGGEIDYKTVDDYGVSIELKSQKGPVNNSAYLQELTFPILPKHILQSYSQKQIANLSNSESDYRKNPVGSGKLKYNRIQGNELSLTRNDSYYDSTIQFTKYILKFFKDEEEIVTNYFLKNIDLYASRGIIDNPDLEKRLATNSQSFTTVLKDINYALYFNLSQKTEPKSQILKSISLRNGVMKLLRRSELLHALGDKGRIVYGPIDQSSWAFSPEVEQEQQYNLDEFKKRAETLGFVKNGDYYQKDGVNLGFTLSYLGGDIRDVLVSQIQNELKLGGVEVKLDQINKISESETTNRTKKINDLLTTKDFEALLTSVTQYQDPDRYSQWHSSQIDNPRGLNISSFDSNVGDLMLTQGRLESDQAKRKEKYIRFQRTFVQDVPAIYLINGYNVNYYSKRISGLDIDIINNSEYRYQNINNWVIRQ